jgi:hypothetical protein
MAGASTNIVPWRESSNAKLGVKEGWQAPHTAWGQPELASAWTSDGVHGVPRERPVAQGTRMFLTEDEYKERAAREEQTRQNAYNASSANTGGRDRALRGQTTFRLASLIVSPANGEYRQSRRLANPGARRAIAGASGKDRSTRSKTSHSTTAASHASSSDP